MDIVDDDLCLCGLAAMRVQSRRQEEDIVFVTYKNDVRAQYIYNHSLSVPRTILCYGLSVVDLLYTYPLLLPE